MRRNSNHFLALGLSFLAACAFQDPYGPEAKAERAEVHAASMKRQQASAWEKYLSVDDREDYWRFFEVYRDFNNSIPSTWRWKDDSRELGEALDAKGYQALRSEAQSRFDSAMVKVDQELLERFGEHFDEYVDQYRSGDDLGERIASVEKALQEMAAEFERGHVSGLAYQQSLIELGNAGLQTTTTENAQIRIIDAGLDGRDRGMIVMELKNLDPTSILYLNILDYGSYQDDSGVERTYRYYSGVKVTDEFGNKYKTTKVTRGSSFGSDWSYKMSMSKDFPLKSGEPLRLKFGFSPLPPEAAKGVEFIFKRGSLSMAEEVRFVVPSKHVHIKRTSLLKYPSAENEDG